MADKPPSWILRETALHLAEAERHAGRARDHIARQERRVLELARDGHDTTEAVDLLHTFRMTLQMHEAEVARLRGGMDSAA